MEYQSKESNRVLSASLSKRLVCMRQSYSEIEETTISLTSLVNEKGSAQIQKIGTSPHLICFQLLVKGKTICLYLGRGGDYSGLWLHDKYLPAEFRVLKDKTVEYLKKEIKGLSIVDLKVHDDLPVVEFGLMSKTKNKKLLWLYGDEGSAFILSDVDKEKSFSSFAGKISNETLDDVIENFCNHRKWKQDGNRENIEEYFNSLEKMVSSQKIVKKKISKIQRKISHIESDLTRLNESQKLKDKLVKDQMEIGESFNVKGLKVKFEKDSGHYQKRDKVLTKLKDWAKARDLQTHRLEDGKQELEKVSSGSSKGDVSHLKVIKVNWSKNKSSLITGESKNSEVSGYDIFELEDGTKIGIGKNAAGNDELRKNWGKKDDYWFHIEGEKGSHLILKGSIKPEYFNLVGSILRDYSGYTGTEIPVIYSTVGKLKGISGKRGAVTIAKPRYFQSVYIDNWREIIANSVL